MDYYFVVLQLPGGKELEFTDDDNVRAHFWEKAKQLISKNTVSIVCVRQDTGVSEAVRTHFAGKGFSTYLLFHLLLSPDEAADEATVFTKAIDVIDTANYEAIIDSDDNFQLVVIDKLDINNFWVNLNAG